MARIPSRVGSRLREIKPQLTGSHFVVADNLASERVRTVEAGHGQFHLTTPGSTILVATFWPGRTNARLATITNSPSFNPEMTSYLSGVSIPRTTGRSST